MPRLRNIQALRFAAAFAVVLFHLTFLYFDVAAMAALSWLRHVGWAGVDIFFVISGFIIYSVTTRLDWSAGAARIAAAFLARRIVRIYPIYWFYFAVFATLVAIGAPAVFHNGWTLDHWPEHLLLLRWIDNKLIPVAWTLTYEMFFYLCVAVTLLFGRYHRVVLVVWIAAEIVITAFNHFAPETTLPGAWRWQVWSNPIVVEFAMGCAVAALVGHGARRFGVAVGLLSFPLFILGSYLTAESSAIGLTSVDYRVITFGLGAALLVYGLTTLELTDRYVAPGWMALLGDASYSLYLCQEAPLYLVRFAFEQAGAKYWLLGVPALAVSIAAVLMVGLLSYLYLERPIVSAASTTLRARRADAHATT